ncbi:MAG: prepilin peptidase [Nitrososphaera sp.]|uniref:A24 family peptidase n=1 Tax=Nitrososphaera sp. TaxID=1971748 RepID=UPI003D6E661B
MEEWRLAASVVMLSIAAAWDLRSRSVSDWLWVSFGLVAAVLYVADPPANLPLAVVSIAVTGSVSFAVYRLGLFGGADSLALFVLALLMPSYSGSLSGTASPLFPLAVFVNALALSTCQVAVNVARNFISWSQKRELFSGFEGESGARKAVAFMVGYRSANPTFSFPIEAGAGAGKRFDFAVKRAENAEYEKGKDVWVAPGLPFLLYLLTGLVVAMLVGDLTGVLASALF